MTYQETLDYLYNLEHFGISLGLENIRELLAACGDPQEQLEVVHVAGSNGKGSTISFLRDMLAASGLKVAVYTSPHLRHFSERIVVAGEPITEEEIVALTRELRPVAEAIPRVVTFFDFTTAMALIHFARCRPDLVLLETGLGGTLDATNVVRSPLLTMITNIALEHEEYLGHTLLAVAREKAGILKPRTPLVSGVRHRQVRAFLEGKNRELGGETWFAGRDFRCRKQGEEIFAYYGLDHRVRDLRLEKMRGGFQRQNACLALAAMEILARKGKTVFDPGKIRPALAASSWPGRLEKVATDPDFYLDGAHNPHGVRALAPELRQLARGRRLILLLGAMKDKNINSMVARLAPLADEVVVTRARLDRSCSVDQLETVVRSHCSVVHHSESVAAAISLARSRAGKNDLVFLTGSLYCVGEALEALQ